MQGRPTHVLRLEQGQEAAPGDRRRHGGARDFEEGGCEIEVAHKIVDYPPGGNATGPAHARGLLTPGSSSVPESMPASAICQIG